MEDDIFPAIRPIIEKYTGFRLKNMITQQANSFDDIFSIYMQINETGDQMFDQIITGIYAAEGSDIGVDFTDKNYLKVLDISRSLDKVKGRITRQNGMPVTICIPIGIFCMGDYIKKDLHKYQMTAEEIAAVTLHEIGHIFSFVEYMGDACFMGYFGNSIMRDVTASFHKDPLLTTDNIIAEAEKVKPKDKRAAMLLEKSTAIAKRFRSGLVDGDGHYTEVGYSGVILRLILTILANITLLVGTIQLTTLFQMQLFLMNVLPDNKDIKRDYAAVKSASMFERLADEYVSRYQMSKHLNEALIKLGNMLANTKFLQFGPIYNARLNQSLILAIIIRVISIPNQLFYMTVRTLGHEKDGTYESDDVRLRRNISNLVDVLKDKSLPPEVRQTLVADIDFMEESLKKKETRYIYDFVSKLMGFIFSIPANILSLPFTHILGSANADKEFFKLFEHLDQMMSNKSFYYAAKIEDIINSKKK
jgi:hypothetical protein